MTLIKSISGIRGTIGGKTGDNLTPFDIAKFTCAFGSWLKKQSFNNKSVVVGRDARPSGFMVESIVTSCLSSMGFDVINIGLATTPTVEIAVTAENACGGIIITASHNPVQWNALKLLNHNGEFLNATDGEEVLKISESLDIEFETINNLGKIINKSGYEFIHADLITKLTLVNTEAIKKANFKVAIDCVNSVGGIALPVLLKKLGIEQIFELYCNPNGQFPHNPEPLPQNLKDISNFVVQNKADVGFVVDPDVDRLAIICEDGTMFGEEYTLVAVADYILSKNSGNTVSNLSSTQALKDLTESYGGKYFSAAVGEVNVVAKMKEVNAIIGGEGNGGVIFPDLHYGRDALVGIALFLSLLAERKIKVSELRKTYPDYFISKNKIELLPGTDLENILNLVKDKFSEFPNDTCDGLKIMFPEKKEWVHLRKSNTEPIIRIYAESTSLTDADNLAKNFLDLIRNLI
ncbi:MAG: phosphoglucosamine mutase [Bacteroidales bacterium]|jgi:phosphomannomutase|nr:phosphoglucosamine mutase [Bacteroidales bacterium]